MIQHFTQYSDANQVPLALYRFAFQGSLSYSYFMTGSDRDFGVIHLDDTIYMFRSGFPQFTNPIYNIVTANLIDFYVSFAKTGWEMIKECNSHCKGYSFFFFILSIPKVLSEQGIVRQCTSVAMNDGNFCDYQEFDNSEDGNGLDIRVKSDFDVEIIEFWDYIFEIAGRQSK